MLQAPWRSRFWRAFLVFAVGAPVLGMVFIAWRASHATDQASAEVLAKTELPFRMLPIARDVSTSVEVIPANPGFQDVVAYKGTVVVSAQAGLSVYDRNGALISSYRTGIELPPTQLGSMAVGTLAGSAQPEVFIATRSEGLLAFDGARFRQILPETPALRIVTAVLVLGSGRILFGTEGQGVLVFDGQKLTPFSERLRSAHITALAGNDGDVWIGTLAGGVFHDRGGQIGQLSALPDPQVLSLAVADEAAYVGTPLGVVEFRDGQRARTLADGFFARALAVRGGSLYVGTEDEGIAEVPLSVAARPEPALEKFDDDTTTQAILRLTNLDGEIYAVEAKAIDGLDSGRKGWHAVIGDRLTSPLKPESIIVGSVWFYFGARYGDYLASAPNTDAGAWLPTSLEAAPQNPDVYLALGDFYAARGQGAQAIIQYEHALELDPDRGDANDHIARVLWSQKRGPESIARWKSAIGAFLRVQSRGVRVPDAFWSRVAETFSDIGESHALGELRGDIGNLLSDYYQRNNEYRFNELLEPAAQASITSGEGTAWLVGLAQSMDDPEMVIDTLQRSPGLTDAQKIALERDLVAVRVKRVASSFGDERQIAESKVAQARWELTAMLLEAGDVHGATEAWSAIAPEQTRSLDRTVEIRLAARTRTLDALLDRYGSDSNAP